MADVVEAMEGPLVARCPTSRSNPYTGASRHLGTVWHAAQSGLLELLTSFTLADIHDGDLARSAPRERARPGLHRGTESGASTLNPADPTHHLDDAVGRIPDRRARATGRLAEVVVASETGATAPPSAVGTPNRATECAMSAHDAPARRSARST